MRRRCVMALAGTMVFAAACLPDAGPTVDREGATILGTSAQCLAPSRGDGNSGSAVVRSRIASVFLQGGGTQVVCLSEESGRWRVRPSPGTEDLAE